MGQREEYLESNEWHESLTIDERRARWPYQASYGLDLPERAREAVAAARRAAVIANHVVDLVKHQAVYALLHERMTIRGIAEVTGIPKSEVGRIARRLGGEPGHPGTVTFPPLPDRGDPAASLVADIWGNP